MVAPMPACVDQDPCAHAVEERAAVWAPAMAGTLEMAVVADMTSSTVHCQAADSMVVIRKPYYLPYSHIMVDECKFLSNNPVYSKGFGTPVEIIISAKY